MIRNIVVIEDEKLNADRLIRLIHAVRPQVVIDAVIDSIADAVEWFATHPHPDVVMMDIRLSDGLSFEIFDKASIRCPVIFTTAYDEYAVRAFKVNSVDYLLKPVEQEELRVALDKLETATPVLGSASLEELKQLLQPKEYRSRFLLPYRDSYKSLLVNDILYIYTEHKISKVKLDNGLEECVPQTMEELEQQLNPKHFFRANRQFIIHIDAIEQVHNYFNGKLKVDIRKHPEVEVLVSRERAALFKSWLNF